MAYENVLFEQKKTKLRKIRNFWENKREVTQYVLRNSVNILVA